MSTEVLLVCQNKPLKFNILRNITATGIFTVWNPHFNFLPTSTFQYVPDFLSHLSWGDFCTHCQSSWFHSSQPRFLSCCYHQGRKLSFLAFHFPQSLALFLLAISLSQCSLHCTAGLTVLTSFSPLSFCIRYFNVFSQYDFNSFFILLSISLLPLKDTFCSMSSHFSCLYLINHSLLFSRLLLESPLQHGSCLILHDRSIKMSLPQLMPVLSHDPVLTKVRRNISSDV